MRSSRPAWTPIPAIIRDTADDDLLRDALLENLHRAELNPLEEAAAYQQLLDDFGCTHEELATRIGRSRPQISNTLRLLKLPPPVQRRVAAGVLSAGPRPGPARAWRTPTSMERLATRIVAEGLSVRAVEEIVALGDGAGEAAARRRPRLAGAPASSTTSPPGSGPARHPRQRRARPHQGTAEHRLRQRRGPQPDHLPDGARGSAGVQRGLSRRRRSNSPDTRVSGPFPVKQRRSRGDGPLLRRPLDQRPVQPPGSPPDASTAWGSSEVSVMPGATFTSRNQGWPSSSTTRSVRDRCRSPNARCAASAASRAAVGGFGRQPRRAEELGRAGDVRAS